MEILYLKKSDIFSDNVAIVTDFVLCELKPVLKTATKTAKSLSKQGHNHGAGISFQINSIQITTERMDPKVILTNIFEDFIEEFWFKQN